MKIASSLVISLLASAVSARPRPTEEGDPLSQKSRITAFVIDKDGNPTVECWEVGNIVDDQQIGRADGTTGTARALSLTTNDDLDGLDILTWPPLSPIWPPTEDSAHAEWIGLAGAFSLFSVQGGLIYFQVNAAVVGMTDDEPPAHIFSLENGDDWFYFEDSYTGSSAHSKLRSDDPPFVISTISATETELLRLRYNSRPKHRVIGKGACSFTGIEIPADSNALGAKTARTHSPLTVQVKIDEDL